MALPPTYLDPKICNDQATKCALKAAMINDVSKKQEEHAKCENQRRICLHKRGMSIESSPSILYNNTKYPEPVQTIEVSKTPQLTAANIPKIKIQQQKDQIVQTIDQTQKSKQLNNFVEVPKNSSKFRKINRVVISKKLIFGSLTGLGLLIFLWKNKNRRNKK